ncbi:MAG: Crp/Fnr family transcriptional regulator, partial [Bacteroidota bacterium]
ILQLAKSTTLKKGEIFIAKGSLDKKVYFIKAGLVRSYYINEQGEEITFRLIPEYNVVVNADYILNQIPSRFFFETLEDSHFFVKDYDRIQRILLDNPKFEQYRKTVLLKLLNEARNRIESFVLLSPEERYLKYIKEFPSLNHRVHDKYIAHVLGINPVSLSRIRKRIAAKKK